MFSLTVCILLGVMVFLSSASSINGAKSLALTIYDQDYAMVKDVREIDFDQGNSDLFFTDVSSNIQTETVAFKALNDTENIRVYEQNYEANLINTPAILQKYIDKKLVVYAKVGSDSRQVNGTLLGFNSGYILQTPFGIEILNNIDGVTLSSLPDGFFTLPTLNWKVSSAKKITSNCEVSYRTNGFSWHADYLVILNQAETKADVGGWVTIDNQSGKKYTNSKVKLIAKDVKAANKNMNIWNGNSFSGQVAPLGSSSSSSVT